MQIILPQAIARGVSQQLFFAHCATLERGPPYAYQFCPCCLRTVRPPMPGCELECYAQQLAMTYIKQHKVMRGILANCLWPKEHARVGHLRAVRI